MKVSRKSFTSLLQTLKENLFCYNSNCKEISFIRICAAKVSSRANLACLIWSLTGSTQTSTLTLWQQRRFKCINFVMGIKEDSKQLTFSSFFQREHEMSRIGEDQNMTNNVRLAKMDFSDKSLWTWKEGNRQDGKDQKTKKIARDSSGRFPTQTTTVR